jgi:Ras-related GTP-binding protein A/B
MLQKVLLMGKSGAGKTSMRSIIFANYLARDTMRLGPTLDVEYSHVRFLGNLVLNLWDCGGQDAFYNNYFQSQRDHIFRNVQVLIYVFDVASMAWERDLDYYEGTIKALLENSPDARVCCLVHKMDLVPSGQAAQAFAERAAIIESKTDTLPVTCYKTSIWDETLYRAWSSIVYSLIPNIGIIENNLTRFCEVCGADEVVLFEMATFLKIAHAAIVPHGDVHRFEKISNIIKQFKLSCSKIQGSFAPGTTGEGGGGFSKLQVSNSRFTALVDEFTTNTVIMVILSNQPSGGDGTDMSGGDVAGPAEMEQKSAVNTGVLFPAAVEANIKAARKHFEQFISKPTKKGQKLK